MGIYINPTTCTKEVFLIRYGIEISREQFRAFTDFSGPRLPVCLVDNGPFKAAAVAYNVHEIRDFSSPEDYRPRCYYIVPRTHLGSEAGIPEGLLEPRAVA